MIYYVPQKTLPRTLATALSLALTFTSLPGRTGETDLANKPLVNATTVDILPNILFILDDSGSMDWNYMPDYVKDGKYCRTNDPSSGSLFNCKEGDPPFYSNAFNGVFYSPLINYTPPVNADGSSKTSYTIWTNVPEDGYGIQSTGTVNLLTDFPERKWCKNSTPCVSAINASNAYVYPDGTYTNSKTVYGPPFYHTVTVEWCSSKNSSGVDKNFGKSGTCQSKKTSTYKYVRYSNWKRVNIVPTTTSYDGPNGTTRTYNEEMTNFANWYAWYRTRMQMTKTGVGQSFIKMRGTPDASDPLDKNYFHARAGFTTISYADTTDGDRYLAINDFNTAQKNTWFTRFYNTDPISSTPLRGALSKAGQIYAGKKGADPLQYSCQRNFTILSTDGYWNKYNEDSSYGPYKESGGAVNDQDGSATRPSLDEYMAQNTLADVAYYYYHTDLRPGTCTLCKDNVPPAGTNANVDDVATHQHMTTFTIGLGVDGTLAYKDGYKSSTSGDYYNILTGAANAKWPDPKTANNDGDETRIDDLWHAAVNGRGTYLSARDPAALVRGLTAALGAMDATSGAGAAAATSNLHITPGDNFIYIANYRTVSWDGELSAYTVNTSSGAVSSSATWRASGELDKLIGTAGDTDTRTIYTSSGSTLKDFKWSALSGSEKAYFDNTKLSQYADWSAGDKTAATGEVLLNYLRGQNRYEDQVRDVSFGAYNRLYRDRLTTLGDIVHAQPVYVQKSYYTFEDASYDTFSESIKSRAGTVYAAANDGMLHAFNSTDGKERWAYVPPQLMPELWRLADKDYTTNHRFFADGPLAIADIKDGNTWKTILIGGLGKGGRAFYALDITNPATPKLMWTFSADDNANLGYSFAQPMVTKVDGQWVALLTSGYNNIPEGAKYAGADGKGYVFMLNAASGAVIKTIPTGSGSVGSPSGLGRINVYVDDFDVNNMAEFAYGGDLLGQMWRFDLKAGTASKMVDLGPNQPITAAPELGYNETSGKRVLYFGTGRYLGQDDLDDKQQQALYAIKDNDTTALTSNLVEQTLSGSGNTTTVSNNAVDWTTKSGWFIKLPQEGERVHMEAQLYSGTIIFTSVIPDASACQPGGSGRVYMLSSGSGSAVTSGATTFQAVYEFLSPIVGVSPVVLGNDVLAFYPITADGKKPDLPINVAIGGGSPSSPESGKRLMWRELAD